MSGDLSTAWQAIAEEIAGSETWWGGEPTIDVRDFGYPEVSILVIERDIAVNLPAEAASNGRGDLFGIPLATDDRGITEVASVGENGLELACVDEAGRLLRRDDPAVLHRRSQTASLVRSAALSRDRDAFTWGCARLRSLQVAARRYSSRDFPSIELIGDARGAAIAGVEQTRFDEVAAAALANLSGGNGSNRFFHTLLTSTDAGITLSPTALLVLSWSDWGEMTVSALASDLALGDTDVEEALSELLEAGLVAWPAPVENVLEAAGMTELRSLLGPQGIKASSRAALVSRARDALGEDGLIELARQLNLDLTRPAFTESAYALRSPDDGFDPRTERITRAFSTQSPPLPTGLPESFGASRYAAPAVWDDDEDEEEEADPKLAATADDLNSQIDALMSTARRLLSDPDPDIARLGVAAASAGIHALVAVLTERAQAESLA